MAEERVDRMTQTRKDLEQCSIDLSDIAETLDSATKEDDAIPLNTFHMETINSQLTSLRTKITEDLALLTRNETDEAAIAEDGKNRTRLFLEWDRLKHCAISLTNLYEAEKISSNIYKSIKRLEQKREENPTKIYKDALLRLDPQMSELRSKLNGTTLPEDHHLWTTLDDYEDRIDSMLCYEPPDTKIFRKEHDKGSYKITALVVPKFSGKIQDWVAFWQEFSHAVDKKVDMDDSTKMIYLKQAIVDPGLSVTISDLGIEEGSYAAAVKVLKSRYDKPRVMHSESLRDLKPSTNSRAI